MGVSDTWQDITYEATFEQEVRGLQRRRESDPTCTIADLERVLQHLYQMEGADWGGRGAVQDSTLAATIAAYEHSIAQWKGSI
ncbi:MAG: hypothetical protein LBQ30_02475 [Treponema sp.]|jgi:hypothetical protein|nr:hypothetical protein [Treponema sp.]